MTAKRLIDVIRQPGEANLGRALLRLARLAESAHRFEAANLASRDHDDARHSLNSSDETGRIDAGVNRDRCTDAVNPLREARRSSSVCTEANR